MLNNLKIMLFGEVIVDEAKDAQLELIINGATSRLQLLLGGLEPPESMNHIILEVAIARYNRIGSEGLSSHTVEGESMSYNDNDFAAYKDEIQAFIDANKEVKKGKVRFL